MAKHWMNLIDQQRENSEFKRWFKRGDTIEKRYRDERNRVDEEGQRRYNSLWSNTEILRPALFGRTPIPVVERRFKDKDPVGRNAASMLERALRNEPEIEEGVSLPPDSETDFRDSSGRIDNQQQNAWAGDETGEDRDREPDEIRRKRPSLDEDGHPAMPPKMDAEERKLHSTGDRIVR